MTLGKISSIRDISKGNLSWARIEMLGSFRLGTKASKQTKKTTERKSTEKCGSEGLA